MAIEIVSKGQDPMESPKHGQCMRCFTKVNMLGKDLEDFGTMAAPKLGWICPVCKYTNFQFGNDHYPKGKN